MTSRNRLGNLYTRASFSHEVEPHQHGCIPSETADRIAAEAGSMELEQAVKRYVARHHPGVGP